MMSKYSVPIPTVQTCTTVSDGKYGIMVGNNKSGGSICMRMFEEMEQSPAKRGRHQTQDQARLTLEGSITSLKERELPNSLLDGSRLILNSCTKSKSREHALWLYAYMQGIEFETLMPGASSVVSMLVETGSMGDSQQVETGSMGDTQQLFNGVSHRSESSWNYLIQGYVKRGEPQEALISYRKMQQEGVDPGKHTFVAVLKACAQLKDMESGCKIHAEIGQRWGLLEQDVFVGSTLVDMYAKCGWVTKAQEVFDKLSVRNLVSWNALLTGYTKQGDGKRAIECYEQMEAEGISPDAVMLLCCLKACGIAQAADKGSQIHKEISKRRLLERDPTVGNALVHMYAKCGLLSEAQDVFDKLPVQDLVVWTALISGFVEYGDATKALRYLEQMEDKGISANAITYICGLKACSKVPSAVDGEKLHGQIVKMGLDKDLHVSSSLVDMYAKCGSLENAKAVLGTCLIRDVVSWNALLVSGFSKQGHPEEVLKCFDQMQHEGVTPDSISFMCSLTACGSVGAATKGEEIYRELSQSGLLERDVSVANAVVNMFAKCGLFEKAREVFQKISTKDIGSWRALIAGYVEHGRAEEVLCCFEQMRCEGFPADALTFICCLDACSSMHVKNWGLELHAEIVKTGLLQEDINSVGNALVNMYVKCGSMIEAQDVFSKLLLRDVISWNSLIGGYVQYGCREEALSCLTQMKRAGVSADSITYCCSLKAHGMSGASEKCLEVHMEIERIGFLERDIYIGITLIHAYGKCGLLAEARDVFEKLPRRDVLSWNALIVGVSDQEQFEEALNCAERMQDEGIRPDAVTFLWFLRACNSIGAIDTGKELHAEMIKIGLLETDYLIGSTLVDMYGSCGRLAEAKSVFDYLPRHDTVSWTALIAAYVEHDHGAEALRSFDMMLEDGHYPDDVTLVCCLRACGSVGTLQRGQEIHADIARIGGHLEDLNVANSLISIYCKCGFLARAEQVFNSLSSPDIISWTALIAGYALLGKGDNAIRCLKGMTQEGVKPNPVTFLCILCACIHSGLVDTGQAYVKAMIKDFGLFPGLEHFVCVIDLLGRAGQLDKAVVMVEETSFKLSSVGWHTLLGACALKSGGAELGRELLNFAMHVDSRDSSAYVCMSNIVVD